MSFFLEKVYAQVSIDFLDPLLSRNITTLEQVFAFILNLILAIGYALVLIMLALGFIQYIMSQGEKANIEKAQKWLSYAVIGGMGLFFVAVIRTAIQNAVGGTFRGVGNGITIF